MKLNLPNRKDLIETNKEDPLKYYYWPLAGAFYKKRLKDVLSLLDNGRYKNLLEIGFGSGIFFPELSKRCDNLFGLEVHDKIKEVEEFLSQNGLRADLRQGSILSMPYESDFFDVVVAVSIIEHVKDLETASREILRILKPDGVLVLGFPARNKITDTIFKLCGFNPREVHPSSHTDIFKVFGRKMKEEKILKIPWAYYSVKFSNFH